MQNNPEYPPQYAQPQSGQPQYAQMPPSKPLPPADPEEITDKEVSRVKIFLVIQVLFLLMSTLTGGFQFKVWSMLDTALMIQSIGISGLIVVLETRQTRKLAFKAAIILYILAIIDMGINVLLSGVVGWRTQ